MANSETLQFGVHIPNLWEYGNPRTISELGVMAEEAGWDGFFVWDHVLFDLEDPPHVCDPWIALAATAICTSRIRLGALMTPIARRRPWKLAREIASLDELSAGRVVAGVGLGVPADAEFTVFSEDGDPVARAEKLDEGLEILRMLWTGEPGSHAGKHYRIGTVAFRPRPVQSRIPIWVGGNWPNKRPFRRAARLDGVMPERGGGELVTPDELREVLTFIRSEQVRQEISVTRFDVAAAGYTELEEGQRAQELVAAYADAGATWWIERFHPGRGDLESTKRRIQAGPPRVSGAADGA